MRLERNTSLIAFLGITTLLFAATIANAGHYYESVTKDQMAGKKKVNQSLVKAWVDGDNARVEFSSAEKEGWFSEGNYLVTTDGGDNVYLVNPKDETFGRFDMEEMMATLGTVMNMMEQSGGMMKMEFTDISSEKLLEEPGGEVLGHSTTHYRFKTEYTMKMNMMGMKRQTRTEMLQDIWATSDLDSRGFGVWLRPDRGMKSGNEGLDELINQELGKLEGFPLKMTNQMTSTNKKGKSQTNNSNTAVTLLREESISGDTFKWPSHYTEIEIIPDIESMQAQDADDGKKKNKKKGLSGMFKKPKDDG